MNFNERSIGLIESISIFCFTKGIEIRGIKPRESKEDINFYHGLIKNKITIVSDCMALISNIESWR